MMSKKNIVTYKVTAEQDRNNETANTSKLKNKESS